MLDRHNGRNDRTAARAADDEDGLDVRARFLADVGRPLLGEELFDAVPDIVFFLKDRAGRYVAVNRTLVTRSGRATRAELIGLTATEVFPGILGEEIARQDLGVIRTGRPIHGRLELHLYADGREGWCLTWKEPVRDATGAIVGLSGISRDLQPVAAARAEMEGLSAVIEHVRTHLDAALRLADLAAIAGLTVFQLDQRIRALFGVSTGQYLTRLRIEAACSLLRAGDLPIARVALDCGYADQAAFTRQFRKSVGLTPSQYRKRAAAV